MERISISCDLSENEVAQNAIKLTYQNKTDDAYSKRKEHIGYYLVDKGLEEMEHACGMHYTLRLKLSRVAAKMPVFIYIFSVFFLAIAFAGGLFYIAFDYVHYN